ncbi:MAG TPA: FAD-linked oxidase C-terminal domain-containing protein [Candidatus Binatia bacterium]|nr:FAD-linked oxidase C-terminal domain-containing protein [Candidatus Binatia bacterium]
MGAPSGGLPADAVGALRSIVGERLLTAAVDMAAYAYDGTFLEGRPAAAVLARTTDEVAAVVRVCAAHAIPIIARGSGTSLTGGSVPTSPSALVLDLAAMNRILDVDPVNMTATVEAGVVTATLGREAARHGLFYPPDPASLAVSTIGGNLACNAGGPSGLKYGVTRDYVLALEVVLADGRIVWLGSRAMKNSSGYPLHHLFVGSEGTLGIITRAVLKLLPKPAHERTLLVGFTALEAAAALVTRVLGAGVLPAAIELVDRVCLDAVDAYRPLGLPPDLEAVLLFRHDGSEASTAAEAERVAAVAREGGAVLVRVAADEAEADELWLARRAVSPALARLRPNKLGEDVAVPRGAIVEMVRRIREISARHRLPIATFGHISDGNLHPNILFDGADADERARMLEAARDIFLAALDLGGVLSGEHGIGVLKKAFLPLAVDPMALELMRTLKGLLDPQGILNPGKVLPDGAGLVRPPEPPVEALGLPRSPFGQGGGVAGQGGGVAGAGEGAAGVGAATGGAEAGVVGPAAGAFGSDGQPTVPGAAGHDRVGPDPAETIAATEPDPRP